MASTSAAGSAQIAGAPRDVLSGAVVTAITLAFGFSFGALLFPGILEAGAGRGMAMTLIGAGVSSLLVALRTSLPPAVGGPDTPVLAALIALIAAFVVPAVQSGQYSVAEGIELTTAIILLTSVLVGLSLLTLGLAKVGSALRFIPYPVVSGFVAGSGLALILGALRLVLQAPLSADALLGLVEPARLSFTAAVLALPILLFALRPFWRPFYLLPLLFFLEVAVIHLALGMYGLSGSEAAAEGWFLTGMSADSGVSPLWSLTSSGLDWSFVLARLPDMAAAVIVACAALLMNSSGLEVAWRRSANLDRELTTCGTACAIGGLFGGAPGSLSMSRSLLNVEAGGRSRLSGVIAGLLLLLCGYYASDLAALVPLPALAGLLLFIGLTMLLDRLAELPPRQPLADYLLMLAIALLIITYGYLEGVLAGIVGACLFFAFTYSRIGIVKHILNRRERASDVERPLPQKRTLEQHGERIRLVGLRGYIFFGTSNRLLDQVRATYPQERDSGPQVLILDFRSVSGIDSSAVVSFLRLAHFCEEWGIELCFSGLSPSLEQVMGAKPDPALTAARRFATQEEALEHAEEVVLAWGGLEESVEGSLERWFARDAQMQVSAEKLAAFLERRDVEAGEVVFSQGEPSDTIELLVIGRVQVVLQLPDGTRLRLRSMLEQTVLGEMGFFRDLPRSATVVAERRSQLYRVTRDAYRRMLDEAPDVAAALHRVIIATLADRLAFANNEIAALKR